MIHRVLKIALEAGREVMEVYRETFSVEYKEDRTPLTEADRRSHRVITEGLRKLDPSIPILSEEGKETPYEERKSWRSFWLVDPLDGTKEFVKRNGEFTVNVALIEGNLPVLGVVFAPALELLYFARRGEGAYRLKTDGGILSEEKAERLPLKREGDSPETLRVVASRSHRNRETEEFVSRLRTKVKEIELVSIGSSLKMCLVAEGRADIYPRLGPTMEWDTAAGHAIALESGCEVKLYNGKLSNTLTYNKRNLLNPPFVVFRKEKAYLFERGVLEI